MHVKHPSVRSLKKGHSKQCFPKGTFEVAKLALMGSAILALLPVLCAQGGTVILTRIWLPACSRI